MAVPIPQKKGEPILFAKDEDPYNVKFDKILDLKPAFIKDGTVTAANASTMNDGAAAVVLMSDLPLRGRRGRIAVVPPGRHGAELRLSA